VVQFVENTIVQVFHKLTLNSHIEIRNFLGALFKHFLFLFINGVFLLNWIHRAWSLILEINSDTRDTVLWLHMVHGFGFG
jgi:hypothetical protein